MGLKTGYDIVSEVYEQFDGKFSKEQILEVLTSNTSYIHHVMRYTNTTRLRIPSIGYMTVNLPEMKKRMSVLKSKKRKGKLSGIGGIELMSLENRIAELEKQKGQFKQGDSRYKNIKGWRRRIHRGLGFFGLQEFQNKGSWRI